MKKGLSEKLSFNPHMFQHPVAELIEWTALRTEVGVFPSRLVFSTPACLEFRSQWLDFLPALLFLLIGFSLGVGCVYFLWSQPVDYWMLLAVLFPLIFTSIGIQAIREFFEPFFVFDRNRGQLWKGNKPSAEPNSILVEDQWREVSLDEIVALQLLRTLWEEEKCLQVNLVLRDARRLHLMTHGNEKTTKENTFRLGDFLEVPVWDVT